MNPTDIPAVNNFEHLFERARKKAGRIRPRAALVVPSAHGWLSAFDRAIREQLVDPFVIGDEQLCHDKCTEYGIELPDARFIDINEPDKAFQVAVRMAARGELDLVVKGRGSTIDFLGILLDKESGFVPKGATLSHIGVIKPEVYPKLLLLTDAGVIPHPDLKTKVALIANLGRAADAMGLGKPRVAVLAAVEAIYTQMQVTTEAAVLAKMYDRGQIKAATVDGPLSFDCAIDMDAARGKGLEDSPVAGRADALLAPNIETANGLFKSLALYGKSETGGILIGGRTPVALGNRWDSPLTRYHSIVLGVLVSSLS